MADPAPRSKPPTIKDVAAAAGLSRSVVSRALSGVGSVSPLAADRVRRAAAELGYRPNSAARTLINGRSDTIGALIRQVDTPSYAELIVGLQARATEHHRRILVVTGNLDVDAEIAGLDTLLSLRVDGLLIGSGKLPPVAIAEAAAAVPTVVHGRSSVAADSVQWDESLSARLMLEHLTALGHREIVLFAVPEHYTSEAQLQAIRAESHRRGVTLRETSASYNAAECRVVARTVRDELAGATAVITLSAWAGIGALSGLQDAGIHVPQQMSLVCYDGGFFAPIPGLGLTSVDRDHRFAGRVAVDLIMERIADRRRAVRTRLVPPSLTVGRTTGPAPRRG